MLHNYQSLILDGAFTFYSYHWHTSTWNGAFTFYNNHWHTWNGAFTFYNNHWHTWNGALTFYSNHWHTSTWNGAFTFYSNHWHTWNGAFTFYISHWHTWNGAFTLYTLNQGGTFCLHIVLSCLTVTSDVYFTAGSCFTEVNYMYFKAYLRSAVITYVTSQHLHTMPLSLMNFTTR